MDKKKTIFILTVILIFSIIAYGSLLVSEYVFASTNISSAPLEHWAWNDNVGWINFHSTGTVNVLANQLQGFADSPIGRVSFDCASGPPGSTCAIDYRVLNDGAGNLSGWAWSDAIGWISFACHNPQTGGVSPDFSCAWSNYRVIVSPTTGEFSGWAWNDTIGWISFSCANTGTCPTSNYRVITTWRAGPATAELISSTFDTQRPGGAAYNHIVWRGALNGGAVMFQLATANCPNGATNPPDCNLNVGWGGGKTSGDGAFLGPDGTLGSWYNPGGPEIAVNIVNQATHNNRRFYRYRMRLESNLLRTASPTVEDVVVNWSP